MSSIVWQVLLVGAGTYCVWQAFKFFKQVTSKEHSFNSYALSSRAARVGSTSQVIKHQPFFLNKDNLYIFWRVWTPASAVKAVIVLSHGINEHSGRYVHFANHLTAKGYKVYALDHQGHGQSEGDRLFARQVDDLVDDVVVLLKRAKEENKGKKLFLLGHSMGGEIAVLTTLKVQSLLDAAIYSAPAVYLDPKAYPVWQQTMVKVLAGMLPKLRPQDLDISTLCRDKFVVDMYTNDPLVCPNPPTICLASALLDGIKYVEEHRSEISLPVLLLHGTGDHLVSIEASKGLYENISSKDKEFKTYDGGFHENFNEPNHINLAVKDLLAWLEKHA